MSHESAYRLTVGLEIHAELATDSKIFCGCKNAFGGQPNTRTCPVCAGLPGALPVLNRRAVELAATAGLALNCTVQSYSAFDRKSYFYPDLPKGYQITQFYHPICTDGFLIIGGRRIGIERVHLEEDAGKLVHDQKGGRSLVDYNRCGVPLIEIVTRPDFHSAGAAKEFVAAVAGRLKYAGVCDGRMEQGSLRCDVNLSVARTGAPLGVRTEMKNLSSLRAVARAIEAEYRRQVSILEAGGRIRQETLRFDETAGVTIPLRDKAEAHDYRYFPEPDLPPIRLEQEDIARLAAQLPEMPDKRQERYRQWGIAAADAALLAEDRALSDFYDRAVQVYPAYRPCAALTLTALLRCLKEVGCGTAENLRFGPAELAALTRMQEEGKVSKNAAREILRSLFQEGGSPEEIARRKGYLMGRDIHEVDGAVAEAMAAHPKAVAQYRAGEEKVLGFLMGQACRRLGPSANPALVRERLLRALGRS